MEHRGSRWLAFAVAGIASACAAVTGLSDYAITGDAADGAAAEAGATSGQTSSGQSSSGQASSGQASSGQATSSSSGNPPPPPSALSVYAQAACELEKRCTPSTYGGIYAGDDDCRTGKEERASPHDLQPAAYDACTAKLRAAACNSREQDFLECHFDGPRATGANCFSGGNCVSGRCVKTDGSALACGVCTASVPAGGNCASSNDCADGLYCKSTCQKRLEAGASCTQGGVPCALGLACSGSVCKARGGVGAACTTGDCASSLSCVNSHCVETTYAQLGQPCNTSSTPVTYCARASCLDSKCVPNAKLGEECAIDGTKPYCDPDGLVCDGTHCIERIPAPTCP